MIIVDRFLYVCLPCITLLHAYVGIFQKLKSLAIVAAGGTVAYGAICAYNNDEKFYKDALIPIMHKLLSPETSQTLGLYAAKWALIPKCKFEDTDILVRIFLLLCLERSIFAFMK